MKTQGHTMASKAGATVRIQAAMEALKPAERSIAEYVLAESPSVIQMSVGELARQSGVGESTVIRFCRTIGYGGYQEFKVRLAQDLVESVGYIHDEISFKDDVGQVTNKIFQADLKAVQDTRQALDASEVENAAAKIVRARKIEIYGIGYSYYTALDAKFKLLRVGLLADAFGDGHSQAMSASAVSKRDVVIGISHSGASRDTVDALALARQSGAATIAVTNFSPSAITRAADIVLLTAASSTPLGGGVLTSRIAQLCVIDVLSAAVTIRLGESCLASIQKIAEAVKNKRY